MLPCTINAKEGRHIALSDIAGALLHAEMDQDVHVLLEGTIAELSIKQEPKICRKYIWKNKHDKPILYIIWKSTIWNTTGVTVILETTLKYTKGMGFQDQWLWPMCGK